MPRYLTYSYLLFHRTNFFFRIEHTFWLLSVIVKKFVQKTYFFYSFCSFCGLFSLVKLFCTIVLAKNPLSNFSGHLHFFKKLPLIDYNQLWTYVVVVGYLLLHYYSIFQYFTWLDSTYIRDIVVILKRRSWSSVNRRTLKGPCLDSWSSRITRTGWPNRVLNVSHHICSGVQKNFFFKKSWFYQFEACRTIF